MAFSLLAPLGLLIALAGGAVYLLTRRKTLALALAACGGLLIAFVAIVIFLVSITPG